jgi:hypothetical protein
VEEAKPKLGCGDKKRERIINRSWRSPHDGVPFTTRHGPSSGCGRRGKHLDMEGQSTKGGPPAGGLGE